MLSIEGGLYSYPMKYSFLMLLLASICQYATAELRIWEDTKGAIWEGEFITMNAGLAVIRDSSGKKSEIEPKSLCETDQKYLEKVLPPKLVIDVSKTTESKSAGINTEQVVCLASIKQADTRMYTGELTAVLVTMGVDIQSGATSKVSSTDYNFTLPENHNQTIEFVGSKNTFYRKAQKKGRAYSGYILVVWDQYGKPIAIKSNRDTFVEQAARLGRPKTRLKKNR